MNVTIYPLHVNQYNSLCFAGFEALHRTGRIQLTYSHQFQHEQLGRVSRNMAWFRVEHKGRSLLVCCDNRDGGGLQEDLNLEPIDVYFKRSIYPAGYPKLPTTEQQKILPIPYQFACRPHQPELRQTIKRHLSNARLKGLKPLQALTETSVETAKTTLAAKWPARMPITREPYAYELEVPASVPCEKKIYFRTRVYDNDTAGAENAVRVALIRALKAEFGDRFVGGLRHTPLAREKYPDCLFPGSLGHQGNLAASASCLVNINVEGLHASTSWRFPEMLAASRCIVTRPLHFHGTRPTEEGTHYLQFVTPEECIQHCYTLLNNQQVAQEMRTANWHYYQAHLTPEAVATAMLETMAQLQ